MSQIENKKRRNYQNDQKMLATFENGDGKPFRKIAKEHGVGPKSQKESKAGN